MVSNSRFVVNTTASRLTSLGKVREKNVSTLSVNEPGLVAIFLLFFSLFLTPADDECSGDGTGRVTLDSG